MPIDRRKTGERKGHDTAYRTRNFHTHPTHVCIEDFCGFEGQDCCLTVEGPIYRSRDGTGYPLGSQLRTEFGWLDLTPKETNLLADEVRSAIDLALLRWFTRPDMAERQLPSRQSRERYFDDDVARNLILSATPPTASMEQDAHAS